MVGDRDPGPVPVVVVIAPAITEGALILAREGTHPHALVVVVTQDPFRLHRHHRLALAASPNPGLGHRSVMLVLYGRVKPFQDPGKIFCFGVRPY